MINWAKLINCHKKVICEFYNVTPGQTIDMRLEYFGVHDGLKRFELDGIEFYQGEDEDLENAIEVCIDEEFLPEWMNMNVSGYTVEAINYSEHEETGYVKVSIY